MTSRTFFESWLQGRAGAATIAAVLLCTSAAMLLTAFGDGFFPVTADEMTIAWWGKQAAEGRAPYQDFFSFLPPLLVFGLGGFFDVFGASLGALRLLSVVWLAATTVALFVLIHRAGAGPWTAAAAALLLPAVLVVGWPVPSHHWFALGFGLAALALVSGPMPAGKHWMAAGALTACAGLCVQTDGLLFAVLLALRVALHETNARSHARVRAALLAAAGLAAPVAITAALLWRAGLLGAAFEHVVAWPLLNYKQPGGINDAIGATPPLPAPNSLPVLREWAAIGVALTIPALLLVSLGASVLLRRAGAIEGGHWRRRWLTSAIGGIVLWGIFTSGRPDYPHLVQLAVVALLLTVLEVDWSGERHRPAVVRAWLAAAFAIGVAFPWASRWAARPPNVTDVLAVDAHMRANSVPSVLDYLPGARQRNLPVLYLAPGGAALYFYWSPESPPVDWIMPPSARLTTDEQYEAIERFADERAVPWVVTPSAYAEEFLKGGSPIGDLLATRYRPAVETPWGIAFARIGGSP